MSYIQPVYFIFFYLKIQLNINIFYREKASTSNYKIKASIIHYKFLCYQIASVRFDLPSSLISTTTGHSICSRSLYPWASSSIISFTFMSLTWELLSFSSSFIDMYLMFFWASGIITCSKAFTLLLVFSISVDISWHAAVDRKSVV